MSVWVRVHHAKRIAIFCARGDGKQEVPHTFVGRVLETSGENGNAGDELLVLERRSFVQGVRD